MCLNTHIVVDCGIPVKNPAQFAFDPESENPWREGLLCVGIFAKSGGTVVSTILKPDTLDEKREEYFLSGQDDYPEAGFFHIWIIDPGDGVLMKKLCRSVRPNIKEYLEQRRLRLSRLKTEWVAA